MGKSLTSNLTTTDTRVLRLASLRRGRGLSLRNVADEIGVHESTVSRWESGDSRIPDPHKQHLAEFFGVSVAYLMGWDQ